MNVPLRTERPDIATPIVEKFGGDARMSELTGHPVKRIEGWRRIGYIGEEYRPWLLAVARQQGIPHTPWDYIAHLVTLPIAA